MICHLAGHILRRVRFCLGQRAAAQQSKRGGKCRKKQYLTHKYTSKATVFTSDTVYTVTITDTV